MKTIPGSNQEKDSATFGQPQGQMNIELYSVRGFISNSLKIKLEEALKAHDLPYTVTEINHVDQFIKAGLASVPAFRIGDHVIQHPHDGDIDATIDEVMVYLSAAQVDSILVPVDFSEESMHAVEYARVMAVQLGYGLTLAHVHQTLYDPVSAGALDVQFLSDSNQKLTELANQYNAEYAAAGIPLHVNAHLEIGEASSSLIELLDHGHYHLMIMATKSTDNSMRRLFGTVSSEVSRHSQKPVIVVPPQASVAFPGRIAVGFTQELLSGNALDELLNFGSGQQINYDFVHVSRDASAFNILKARLADRLEARKEMLTGFEIVQLREDEKRAHDVLSAHAADTKADMVVLVSHHRGFFENLTHSSVTKKALQHPAIPVMVIHHDA